MKELLLLAGIIALVLVNVPIAIALAIAAVIAEGKDVTYDLKPRPDDPTAVGTAEFGDAVIRALESGRTAPARTPRVEHDPLELRG